MSDQIGRVLSGRYRLIAPIGSGASAQVFLAEDTRLRRRVAVKVLHAGLSEDESFLRRFRAEARAAAALNHPHILSVYDWGDEDEPYLVTEFLDGGSLRGMLDAGHRLSPSQALLVGLEACRALDYAHRRGFVHRDIKPANLLFGDDGRLRIADFGLARALAEAAWTEPSGVVLGTARYASPEQARGELVDGRADVYALALVLIESVTGHVPFAADTTIATLMARINRHLEVPPELGPLRRVLVRAGRSEPAERPDAGEFGVGLMAAAEELDRPAPLPLVGATETVGGVEPGERNPTLLPGAGAASEATAAAPVVTPGTGEETEPTGKRRARRQRKAERRAALAAARPRRRRWPWIAVAVVVVLGLAGAGFLAWDRLMVPSHPVPDLIGLTEEQADALVGDFDWSIERREGREDGSSPGEIIDQEPEEGVELKEGDTLAITVSLGNTLVPVPLDLAGMPMADAQVAIENAELAVGEPTRQFDEAVAIDVVIGLAPQTPDQLPKAAEVVLVVSDGPAPREVPALPAGTTFDQAAAALAGVQLQAAQVEEFSDTVPAGHVVRTDPAAGTQVPRDTAVSVMVSKGPQPIPIPDVAGASVADATATLQNAGFVVAGVTGNPTGTVLATDPPAGEPHQRGTSVILFARR